MKITIKEAPTLDFVEFCEKNRLEMSVEEKPVSTATQYNYRAHLVDCKMRSPKFQLWHAVSAPGDTAQEAINNTVDTLRRGYILKLPNGKEVTIPHFSGFPQV